jgi:hypothetical protein
MFLNMWKTLSRFLRWLFRGDQPYDTLVEEYLRRNREALKEKRQSALEQGA